MAQSPVLPAPALTSCRQFILPNHGAALDAYMAVTNRDPDGLIRIVHFVPEHKVVVEEENGDTAAALMREAGIDATGETIILPGEDIWLTIDPPDFPDADQD
jgi:hypothetical protein